MQTYVFYEGEPAEQTVDEVRVEMISRALGGIAADMDGMITDHSETLAAENGAAVLRMTAHAVEQIGAEAVDDSEIPAPAPEEQAKSQTDPP